MEGNQGEKIKIHSQKASFRARKSVRKSEQNHAKENEREMAIFLSRETNLAKQNMCKENDNKKREKMS